jgi:hypothetical protein
MTTNLTHRTSPVEEYERLTAEIAALEIRLEEGMRLYHASLTPPRGSGITTSGSPFCGSMSGSIKSGGTWATCQKERNDMGEKSMIEWTQNTWNPWQGCHKVSPGCKFCYMYRDKDPLRPRP